MKQLLKHISLFFVGGLIYVIVELLWRGHSHWTMFLVGGLCFVCIGLINEFFTYDMPLLFQMGISSLIITFIEFISGLIVNIILKLHVWDYSNLPLNILGQVCIPFTILWFFLSLPGIFLDDWIRWKFFGEGKTGYVLFPHKRKKNNYT